MIENRFESKMGRVKKGARGNDKRIENLNKWRSVFWDLTDLTYVDLDERKEYIIERVFQYGEPEHAIWLMEKYTIDEIRDVLGKTKIIGEHTRQFWYRVFAGIP